MPPRVCRSRGGVFVLALVTVLAATCGGATPEPIDAVDAPIVGSFGVAAKVALGAIFDHYGTDAQPLPVEVTGEIVTHDGQAVWRIDGTYEATVDGTRRQERWRFWVGPTPEQPLTVIEREGPA